ncbi:Cytochrome P450 2B19 [Mycena sanguinolenta]|uniref:Cytochrome P450 2B19 n=1 Tax=Mycena sanguinolenta TaxID=230812 RepID=A0A8H6XJU2_9AGAR|nr:Cytochrome P450 2B19 [Mycena sanguinolenta]
MHTFILACILYPEWIPRAQKEIDTIVGEDRLPSFKDRPHLPYVEAIVRETLRWRPAARFGVPHQSTADDVVEYKGKEYFIPKGSIIFAVSWSDESDPKTGLPFKYDDSDSAFSGEITSAPFKFPAVFEPHSMQRAEVVRQEWVECEKDLNVLLPRHKEQ